MENKLKEIVLNKDYFELSNGEKSVLPEWCQDEVSYDALKSLFFLTEEITQEEAKLRPASTVKNRLDLEFDQQFRSNEKKAFWMTITNWLFPVEKPLWYRPALQFAFLGVLALIVLPFFMHQDTTTYIQVAKKENITIESKTSNVRKTNNLTSSESDVSAPKKSTFVEDSKSLVEKDFDVFEDIPAMAESTPEIEEPATFKAVQSTHTDGVYARQNASFNQSVKEQEGILDLIYPTF